MTDRELRNYRRQQRRQQELRRRRISVLATICLIAVLVISYHALTTSASSGNERFLFKYYTRVTLQQNDTLWDIADEYIDYSRYSGKQEYIKEVCSINHLEDADDLAAGQTIVVPYYSAEYIK